MALTIEQLQPLIARVISRTDAILQEVESQLAKFAEIQGKLLQDVDKKEARAGIAANPRAISRLTRLRTELTAWGTRVKAYRNCDELAVLQNTTTSLQRHYHPQDITRSPLGKWWGRQLAKNPLAQTGPTDINTLKSQLELLTQLAQAIHKKHVKLVQEAGKLQDLIKGVK